LNLSLVLNHACNLRCRYCYTGRKFDRAMPLALAKQAVDFGFVHSPGGQLTLGFFGGEPMLEVGLMAAIARYAQEEAQRRAMSVRFSLSTNGTLVDDARIRFLREFSVHLQVSVDGAAAAQDAARPFADGSGSFTTLDENLRRLLREGLVHQLVAVVTPATVPALGDSFQYLAALGVPEIYFAPDFSGHWSEAACARLETELHAVTDAYAELFRSGQLCRVDPLYGKIVTHLIRGRQTPRRCGFAENDLAVSPRGKVYPCDRMVRDDENPGFELGDLSTGIDQARQRALQALRLACDPECATCELAPRCATWCGCAQFETTGGLGHLSPLFCWFERLFIAEADRLASALFAERNPTFLRDLYRLEPVDGLQPCGPAALSALGQPSGR
jgi:uncharacterized protein